MDRKITIFLQILLICILLSCKNNDLSNKEYKRIEKQLDSLRVEYNIPAIAYGVVRNDSIILQNVIGLRNIETKNKAKVDDLFHIGSNTKSFTSFIAGKLVEGGFINWNTKLFDVFPEMKPESNPAYYEVTLQQLLSHRARLINFKNESEIYPIEDYEKNIGNDFSLVEKRYHFIKQVLKYEPIPIFEHHDDRYSNAGYIATSLMLEKTSGKQWEELITDISEKLNFEIIIGWPDSNGRNIIFNS